MKKFIWILLVLVSVGVFGFIQLNNTTVEAENTTTVSSVSSVPPVISSWLLNRTGATGYSGILANVQQIRYSDSAVYINATDIPTYNIGPFPGNPGIPADQSFVLKIPRNPVAQTGTRTSTPMGPIGIWRNGVALFNSLDGMSYQNQNIWHQNAVVAEAGGFDDCLGHPAPGGVYHHHQNPRCLYTITPTQHSPLLGYAFDGFPIYGAYGYTNSNGTGGIKRINSSYQYRSITQRRTLPDGTVLQSSQYGPDVSTTNPLGKYNEDFEYVAGLGDLDEFNGRTAVTPEYPNGTYAYYVTIYEDGTSAYPYYLATQYYGVVATENITQRGRVTVSEPTTTYIPATVSSDFDGDGKTDVSVFRPSDRVWYVQKSSDSSFTQTQFGLSDDKVAPADFDGDGKTDISVYRSSGGVWYRLNSNDNTFTAIQFGISEDIPTPADFDADGKADLAVFRPSTGTWWIQQSSNSAVSAQQFGFAEDKPTVGDYDGDGKADIAVYRPSNGVWYHLRSSDGGFRAVQWGLSSDKTVPADYDGDGKTDFAVFRSSTGIWYVLRSSDSQFTAYNWGLSTDQPATGDFDGDGKADYAVFRGSNGVWYINQSSSGSNVFTQFGLNGDLAVAGANVR